MNKKIICMGLVGMFLLLGFSAFSAIGADVRTNDGGSWINIITPTDGSWLRFPLEISASGSDDINKVEYSIYYNGGSHQNIASSTVKPYHVTLYESDFKGLIPAGPDETVQIIATGYTYGNGSLATTITLKVSWIEIITPTDGSQFHFPIKVKTQGSNDYNQLRCYAYYNGEWHGIVVEGTDAPVLNEISLDKYMFPGLTSGSAIKINVSAGEYNQYGVGSWIADSPDISLTYTKSRSVNLAFERFFVTFLHAFPMLQKLLAYL